MSRLQGLVKGLLAVLAVCFSASTIFALDSAAAASAESAPCCCKERKIDYKHHLLGCNKFKCCDRTEIILEVEDPCTCEKVMVPVCVPCCCEGVPEICSHKGILGREVVEYKWCCGFHLKVVFDRCGDITVHYYGK